MKEFLAKYYYLFKSVINFISMSHPDIHWIRKGEKNSLINSNEIPKIIWMYWDSDKKNDLVDFCIYNTKKICQDYKVLVLNKENISEYIDLPVLKDGLKTAVIADYIRLSLLKKYGGIWMDASILLTENFDWFLSKLKDSENFVFYTDNCTTDINFPITENWFIAARKNSEFISDWLQEFQYCLLSENPNTYYKKYEHDSLIQKIPNTDYLMCYISAAIITAKKEYSILYANSGSVGHYYNYVFDSSSYLIGLKIFKSDKSKIYIPPLIKFTKDTRYYPNNFIQNRLYKPKSLFSSILDEYYKELDKSKCTGDIK
ncbi:glycosyltransferase family 32 protein [Acinetobacter pollinis]|uniref:glycosyltransferase family 32 protein n=1 Tax=Acinetobacter pollinis TaxID=2605270 RepID=UPI0018C2DB6D|nr:capsular polysaccharide synthesis protein [Acinetobacter pollinis]MBF7692807.1 hypothetical protein [Acinetobacter pollinis]MBF7700714.1 hypothetical protein [Acinetobacter pollinis]